ncbi:MAG TPA: tetratricopeptide repeat protein [Bacteroidia bacterium]|nr:tetratricopeptide repeat protein [Bacteroidia bacterium]
MRNYFFSFYTLFLLLFCTANSLSAQDTLLSSLQKAKHDSTRLRLCLAIAAQQTNNNLDTTFYYCNKAETIARKMNSAKGIADVQYQRAYAVYYSGDGDSALTMYHAIIVTYRSLGDSGQVAACFNKVGFIHREKGDRVKALESYQQALKSNLNESNKAEAGNSYLNIGLIYHDQKDLPQALTFQLLGLSMYEQSKDKSRTANALLRIGNVYGDMKQDSSALIYYQRSFAISQEIESNRLIAICLNNMAMIYSNWHEDRRALGLYKQALVMREKIGDKNGVALVLNNIGATYTTLGIFDSALYYVNKSLELSKEIEYKDMEMDNYLSLSKIYRARGEMELALDNYEKYHDIYEAINNEQSTNEINRLNTSLEAERKQKQIDLLSKEGELREAALQQERTKAWFLVFGLIGVVALAVYIWISDRKTKRTNILLEAQKSEIAEKKKIVEEQHRDIVDSVNYALRIQQAVLPSRTEMKNLFPESFLIYKPRDIVSGDFWWMTEKAGMKVIVVADCTGHGVPGAFMSLIGTSLLNEIINEKGITTPDLVLNMLSEKVVKALHQNEERASAHDGMDIALAVIDEKAELMHFAGANNSLYYTTIAGELHEIKGDRQPIGIYVEQHRPFNTHTISLKEVTNMYMFTDGYVDQFCGNAGTQFGKKIKYSRLKTTLASIQGLNSVQQKDFLFQTFEDWKGSMFQVDDVLLMGIRFY